MGQSSLPPSLQKAALARVRLDVALVRRGIVTSRERAKEAIASGGVFVNGSSQVKPSTPVDESDVIEMRGERLRYVGRGGLKLERALRVFDIDLAGMTCVDLGASTGGFTDCMLQGGAARVFSVDVGHGQLSAALRADPRVTSMEGTDARSVTPELLGCRVPFVATDVSFIPLGMVLPAIAGVLEPAGRAVCLIKPQFEAGKGRVGKRGVVRDPAVHAEVIARVLKQAIDAGLEPVGLDHSPIRGPEGNIEYLLLAIPRLPGVHVLGDGADRLDVTAVVQAAHRCLAG